MRLKSAFIFATVAGLVSCGTGGDSSSVTTDASGTYVREYAVEVTNPETGKKIGMRQVRDSIFIVRSEDGYQVSNRKWRMNDYDQEGWVSMAHSDDRPLPTFFAEYDERLEALAPRNMAVTKPIFIDSDNGTLFKDETMQKAYQKID